ncbi:MAG: hypothetical protein SWK90_13185 [Chloroflexota bacterium]|nr:hypothetical protein [Chloroflexota bacterium]
MSSRRAIKSPGYGAASDESDFVVKAEWGRRVIGAPLQLTVILSVAKNLLYCEVAGR